MSFSIHSYHPSDLPALYRICLLTGDHGQDASQLYQDPDLIGHYYAAPYAVAEPDLCFVLGYQGQRCGYIMGTRDTSAFRQWCEDNWFSQLRMRYPLPAPDDTTPDAGVIRMIHHQRTDAVDAHYPAHLHIDLLPSAQGQGQGHRLMQTFLQRLRELGVRGVHLGVSKRNPRAVRFYEKEGFAVLREYPTGLTYGMLLS